MFLSIRRAGLAVLYITNSVLARNALAGRAADCTTQCQPMQAAIASSETAGVAVLCTPDVANAYKTCLGCEVAISLISQFAAQGIADSLVANCKTAGHPIDSIAVTSINPTAPAPVTTPSTPAPPASVTSDVDAASTPTSTSTPTPIPTPTPTPTPIVPGSVSVPASQPAVSTSSSDSVPAPSLPPATISSSSPSIVPTAASKPVSGGAPAGTALVDPAPSAVGGSSATNGAGAGRYPGHLELAHVAFVFCVLSVHFV
ncbi:hypothetical protein DFH08DRAFT_239055 [Mycena albidolilacea]|uniref:Uncharacterized protein n=1 Tax=Mycena albidolilacea TaxID=1033008 RepID=A0AAD7EP91_9AGAR|nr:hypothetical protein DFH08DRAFT_239055 [Mycena albidolilacea]